MAFAELTTNRKRYASPPPLQIHDPKPEENPKCKKLKIGDGIWNGLDLLLSIQNKQLPLQRKIELAFDFISSEPNHVDKNLNPVSIPRLVSSLSVWVQSVLFSDQKKQSSELLEPCLDFRYWAVLRFCLVSSQVPISQNLLSAFACVAAFASSSLKDNGGDSVQLFEQAFECLSAMLASDSRVFYNAGVELWVSCVVETVALVLRILQNDKHGCCSMAALLKMSGLLLEHFASFLRFHPNPKNVFRVFVDRLLEPLLELLVLLHLRNDVGKCSKEGSLLKVVEEVLSNGLFHPFHMNGFVSLKTSTIKQDGRDAKGINESYHRHFFRRLEKIIAEKKAMALGGFGFLLRMFAARVKARKMASLSFKSDQALRKESEACEEAQATSKPLFEVFVQFMEPLLFECKRFESMKFSGPEGVSEIRLVEGHCMLKSVNETLASFIRESIYIRTEDTSEGAHFSFLKDVFETIVSISGRIFMLWMSVIEVDDGSTWKLLSLLAREALVSMEYMLEIEYKAFGEDLVRFWLVLLSYSAFSVSLGGGQEYSLLHSQILVLACKLITVYSELRQVNIPLFALCKAIRLLTLSDAVGALGYAVNANSSTVSSETCLKSVESLLCSQKFRLAISTAVKSIPEGQASGCIRHVMIDFTDSLEWMRLNSVETDGEKSTKGEKIGNNLPDLDLQVELLGRFLSEIYVILLDSLTVTSTNCILIGNSIKSMMKEIRPSFTNLVQGQSERVDDFCFSVIGRKLSKDEMAGSDAHLSTTPRSMTWVFVFYFRIYLSWRSLSRQAVSLMPPDLSQKASEAMGSPFVVSCGADWIEKPNSTCEGYFSWIVKPSISLLDAIKSLTDNFLLGNNAPSVSLAYVFRLMALQRLVDLNRYINSYEFLHERGARLAHIQLPDDAHIQKVSKKWKRLVKVYRQEAVELTNFIMSCLPSWALRGGPEDNGGTDKMLSPYDIEWDLGVCSLSEKSLPIAIWWLLCRNTDVWCVHATNKNLKRFCSRLLYYSLPCRSNAGYSRRQITEDPVCSTKVTMNLVSLEFLNNTVSYEQKVLLELLPSRFCHILKNSLLPTLVYCLTSDVDLCSPVNWSDVMHILERKPIVLFNGKSAVHPLSDSDLVPFKVFGTPSSERQITLSVEACESLLKLLQRMLGAQISASSFTTYATCLLNMEKFLVCNLISYRSDSALYEPFGIFRLYTSCRRTLKYLVMTALENVELVKSLFSSVLFDNSSSILWLLKSVSEIVGLPYSFFGDRYISQVKDMIFSLMDHTASIFFLLITGHMNLATPFMKKSITGGLPLHDSLNEQDSSVESKKCYIACESMGCFSNILKKQMEDILVTLKSGIHDFGEELGISILNWNTLSSVLSCSQGLLRGLASALDDICKGCSAEVLHVSRLRLPFDSKLRDFMLVFEDLVNLCLKLLLLDGQQETKVSKCKYKFSDLGYGDNFLSSDVLIDVAPGTLSHDTGTLSGFHLEAGKHGGALNCSEDCAFENIKQPLEHDHVKTFGFKKEKSSPVRSNYAAKVLKAVHEVDLPKLHLLQSSLLQSLLQGEHPQVAFALKELFIASAALLKLKSLPLFHRAKELHTNGLELSSVGMLTATAQAVLQRMAEMAERPHPCSFIWLGGILEYLEVFGSYFSLADPDLSKNVNAELIDIHLRAIGKCISLQGKAASLSYQEGNPKTKMLQVQEGSASDIDMLILDQSGYNINAFQARLRKSFQKLIRKPLKLHLLTAVQALQRAIIGVNKSCSVVYEINTGNVDGGKVSSYVAAGIDCLDLFLEIVPGRKDIIKRNISSLVSGLLNIVLHLQSPSIFYLEKAYHNKSKCSPDPGMVILMCIRVLTKVAGGLVYKMDHCHVSQCLHMPGALFQNFHQLKASIVSHPSVSFSRVQDSRQPTDMDCSGIDRQFAVELYAACCRLLCATLRHRKWEGGQLVALVENSATTLLCCLEMVDSSLSNNREGYFVWSVDEAVKCASFFRRVYEEVRQQKDVFGGYASHFLSSCITVYSGYGPLKLGIKREVDEALRPGVYSLIDICTPADLQRLHTILAEASCRSTLANLQRDYRLNFQYEGKI